MDDLQKVTLLITEACDRDDTITAAAQVTGEPEWVMQVEDLILDLSYEASTQVLWASLRFGPVPQHNREEIFEACLTYNFLGQSTGGARMAISGPEGEFAILAELPVATLSSSGLATVAVNLVAKARQWQAICALPPGGPVQIPAVDDTSSIIRI